MFKLGCSFYVNSAECTADYYHDKSQPPDKCSHNYDDLTQYLNDSLREEKIGTAWYDGNSIKITDINERLTVCDIFFDEDDICVSCDGKGKWFSSEQDKEDIKKYIEKLIHKLDKK